jgi:hypothetical protein
MIAQIETRGEAIVKENSVDVAPARAKMERFSRRFRFPYGRLIEFEKNPVRKTPCGLYNHPEETHGRRYSTYLQRLWTGFYFHRCRSGVLSGTRLFDPQAL